MRNLFALAETVCSQRPSLRAIAWILSVGLLTLLQLAVVAPSAHAQVPGAPTGLTATGATSSIAVSWTAPSGTVTSYNVYRGTSSGGESATPIETGVSTTAFTDTSTTGLINGYTYYYEVAAVNGSGTGTSTTSISYTSSGYVDEITDGNGNTREYTSVDASGATTSPPTNYEKVTVTDSGTASSYAYTVNYDNNMNELSRTDGGDSVIPETKVYGDADNPYSPTKVTDANGHVTEYTYDSRGNENLLETDSRFTGTPGTSGTEYLANVNTFSYANFGLGELTQTQDKYMLTGSPSTVVAYKSPTTYSYCEPSGNVESIVAPTPNTVDSSTAVTTSFTYDDLGDITSIDAPGNNAASSITTTLSYGTTPAIGEALTATDALSHSMTFTYDAQGNKTSQIDALDNETDFSYVDPNTNNGGVTVGQIQSTTYPPTTSVLTARAELVSTYLYPGGPKVEDETYSESGAEYREVFYTYGAEGEQLSVTGSTQPAAYTYDDQYRIATQADGNGNTTHYYYNARGYLNAMTFPGYSGSTPTWSSSAGDWTGISGADSTVYSSYDGIGDATSRVDGRDVTTAPSRLEALPPPAPLRTVQDTFASHGSSISNAPLCFTGRGGLAQYWQG